MFTLLYGLWKYLFQKDEYFILILGLDNAGKTVRIMLVHVPAIINYLILKFVNVIDLLRASQNQIQ